MRIPRLPLIAAATGVGIPAPRPRPSGRPRAGDGRPVFQTSYAVPPGEFLLEMIEEGRLTRDDLRHSLDLSTDEVIDLLSGSRPIDAADAACLASVSGTPASRWLDLESTYEQDLVKLGLNRKGR